MEGVNYTTETFKSTVENRSSITPSFMCEDPLCQLDFIRAFRIINDVSTL